MHNLSLPEEIMSNNGTKDNTEEDNPRLVFFAGIIIIPVIIIAVVGNILTICCFCKDKDLHKACNVYILHLAVADLMTGSISMPIYLTYTFSGNVWHFGYHFCKVFLLFDMVASGVTPILMVSISYDRLILMKQWSNYYKAQTVKRAHLKCMLAWFGMLLLNSPATIGWDIWKDKSVNITDCEAQFFDSVVYISIMTVVQFVLPLVLLIALHSAIVIEIRKLIQAREKLITNIPGCNDSFHSVIQLVELRSGSYENVMRRRSRESNRSSKGTKAAKSLAILTIAFFVTWAPYGIIIIVQSACIECVSTFVMETFTWILWFKSALNPFLYALSSNRFRYNFRYFLCLISRQYDQIAGTK